jgi:hypothetical protein
MHHHAITWQYLAYDEHFSDEAGHKFFMYGHEDIAAFFFLQWVDPENPS